MILCRRSKITDGSQQIGGCDQGASCEDKKVSQIKDDLFQVFTPDAEIIYHITAFEAVIQVALTTRRDEGKPDPIGFSAFVPAQ